MGCTVWEEQISALVDGELGDQESKALFSHLGGCPACRDFYRRIVLMREEVHSAAAAVPVQANLTKDKNSLPSPSRLRPDRWASFRISRATAIAAVFLIMVLGGTTAALVLERGHTEARVVFVVGLPTIEVEATYLPSKGTKL